MRSVCVVIPVPHGVGVDHPATAGEARGQVSPFSGPRLSYLRRAWHPPRDVPAVPDAQHREDNHSSIPPRCIPPPHLVRQLFSTSIYSLVESIKGIISRWKKCASVVWRNLLGGTLRRFETEAHVSPQLTFWHLITVPSLGPAELPAEEDNRVLLRQAMRKAWTGGSSCFLWMPGHSDIGLHGPWLVWAWKVVSAPPGEVLNVHTVACVALSVACCLPVMRATCVTVSGSCRTV